MSNRIDLMPFCSTSEYRTELGIPFRYGEWTYATDGKIMVRVPAIESDPLPGETAPLQKTLEDALSFGDGHVFSFAPLRVMFPPIKFIRCVYCDGTGISSLECVSPIPCGNCNHTGNVGIETSVSIGGAFFDARYIEKIAALPGAEFPTNPVVPNYRQDYRSFRPTPFRFTGGIGALMLRRGEASSHLGDIDAWRVS